MDRIRSGLRSGNSRRAISSSVALWVLEQHVADLVADDVQLLQQGRVAHVEDVIRVTRSEPQAIAVRNRGRWQEMQRPAPVVFECLAEGFQVEGAWDGQGVDLLPAPALAVRMQLLIEHAAHLSRDDG
jgi:hypothetical protein